jgi:hypothetical protein
VAQLQRAQAILNLPAGLPLTSFIGGREIAMKKTLLQLSLLLTLTVTTSFAIDNLKLNSQLNYSSDSLDGSLITGDDAQSGFVAGKTNYVIMYGLTVEVNFDRDEMLIDVVRSSGIGVGIPIHEIAPRTPHRSHIQEDGTIQFLRVPEGRRAPRVPIHRLRDSPLEVRRTLAGKVVRFLLRRCGNRPGQAQDNRQREKLSHETSDWAGGNKFQSASLSYSSRRVASNCGASRDSSIIHPARP